VLKSSSGLNKKISHHICATTCLAISAKFALGGEFVIGSKFAIGGKFAIIFWFVVDNIRASWLSSFEFLKKY